MCYCFGRLLFVPENYLISQRFQILESWFFNFKLLVVIGISLSAVVDIKLNSNTRLIFTTYYERFDCWILAKPMLGVMGRKKQK
jgi:hypothetical protein